MGLFSKAKPAPRHRREVIEIGEFPALEPLRAPRAVETPPGSAPRQPRRRISLLRIVSTVLGLCLLAFAAFIVDELSSNRGIAHWLAEFSRSIEFKVREGPAQEPLVADQGPYDQRLGYTALPAFRERLEQAGYEVSSQARNSPRMKALKEEGLYTIYDEKSQAGLQLRDMQDAVIYEKRYPARVYTDFAQVPALVLTALQYVEDRQLLQPDQPFQNPVVDWDRLFKAVGVQVLKKAKQDDRRSIGASTVATQLEKIRHSPDGMTSDSAEKLRQMLSATLRVYSQGADTTGARERLAVDYLNALPLSAQAGYGEVTGLGDGLAAWYGSDFAEVNRVLSDPSAPMETRGVYFKQALSLILSARRPSYYLGSNQAALQDFSNSYLRRMAAEGVIPAALRDAAIAAPLSRSMRAAPSAPQNYVNRKGVNLSRNRLRSMLGLNSLYELDRIDLSAHTSLHAQVQEGVTRFLGELGSRERVAELGLTGERLLSGADPSRVIYSMVLYEQTPAGQFLRVNADNLNEPLDINAGARLDLGSTAKLRTLITWLELIADARDKAIAARGTPDGDAAIHPKDRLSQWVADYLRANPSADLDTTLAAAMQRRYSASPATSFYTGGGLHRFANFEATDNTKVLSVEEALRRSVNLVFIRMMREIVDHLLYRAPDTKARLLEEADNPQRADYLRRFAEKEGRVFLSRFYSRYKGKTAEDAVRLKLEGMRVSPRALTVILRSTGAIDSPEQLAQWLAAYAPEPALTSAETESLYERYGPEDFNLNDRGYLARTHPLELWLISYLGAHPDASLGEVLDAAADVRQEVYNWLLKSKRRRAQDRRILDLLEIEAFQQIQQAWARLGYPFASLTPSLASSIGSSGDRPAALAQLMGIIIAGGTQHRLRLIDDLKFAEGTPYETTYDLPADTPLPVMRPEVARTVRAALIDVVENGTGRSLVGQLARPDGTRRIIGGKTGTGDHRFEVYAGRGQLIESRVVNRVATFVFQIDDRFFGTITAFVPGQEAAKYRFTSGLPVRLLGALLPVLGPLIDAPAGGGQVFVGAVPRAEDKVRESGAG